MGEHDASKTSNRNDLGRAARLAKALRENLKRRKTQSRGREEAKRPEAEVPSAAHSKQP